MNHGASLATVLDFCSNSVGIPNASGVAAWNMVAIPASVCGRIGLPEGRWIKHNFADVDFTFRAHQAGIPVLLVPAAVGVAGRNDTATYWSWADARLSWLAIMQGFGSPKVWWYALGLIHFKIFHFGLLGAADCGWLFCKAIGISIFKGLPNHWLTLFRRKFINWIPWMSDESKTSHHP